MFFSTSFVIKKTMKSFLVPFEVFHDKVKCRHIFIYVPNLTVLCMLCKHAMGRIPICFTLYLILLKCKKWVLNT